MIEHNKGRFAYANGLNYHYITYGESGLHILLLHSLSANAAIFQGLVARGLSQNFQLIIPDLRGRGNSDKPGFGYTLEQDSRDLIALLDELGIARVIVCGHSFGGLLGVFFAAHYPERVSRVIILDAATTLNPLTPALISYSTMRLLRVYPSWDKFLSFVRKAPFMTLWDASMLPFLRLDVIEEPEGIVRPRSNWIDISKAAANISAIPHQQWRKYFAAIKQPALLIQANEPYAHGQYIVEEDAAIESIALMPKASHEQVDGNHVTMLFGDGASQIVTLINEFCAVKVAPPKKKEAQPA